jgi:sulfur transfer complex TusBCD TusB component (DsrH family)
MLRQIQKASEKASSTDSVRWYTIPTDTAMPSGDVVYTTIGFVGTCAENGSTFQLYLDDEKTGAKTYHVYFKQLGGGNLTLTTGKTGANNLVMPSGTYVAIIYVDELGNITMAGATATSTIEAGNNLPATSEGVYRAIQSSALTVVDVVQSDNMNPVTSNAVYVALNGLIKQKQIRINDTSGYALSQGFYTKTMTNFFSTNGIDYRKVMNIRQVNNGNDYYPYFFICSNTTDVLKIFKLANINNTYVDIKVYYFEEEVTRKGGEDETKEEEPIEEPKEEEKK